MIASANLEFGAIYKLAVYAQTPTILLQLIMMGLGRPFSGMVTLPLGILVSSVYLWQAIRQLKTPALA
jgi:hypothetical protein